MPGDQVFLLVEGEAPRVIEAESVLEAEILEAYAALSKPLADADVFILEFAEAGRRLTRDFVGVSGGRIERSREDGSVAG